ncbi:hypothetical protein OGAPHI_004387 [Ogataea philodendri]|uniref:methionyl-tRNA formyltransferase n=1 Tax=Ogataea philodendri TaxID=1378263 RepID=A0A9P8T4Q2_9ASCO|nr:uncharacterized protein OGAPHI_004387 [Ogataea philodendri]KAH3666198.1 hypothetical protein OGAPHI_004387 [Ogataea philodendri]
MLKIAYFGSDLFSINVLLRLLPSYHANITVVTREAKLSGRGMKSYKEPALVHFAQQTQLPLLRADSRHQFDALAGKFDLCIAVSYGKLIPGSFLETLRFPGLNVHPSLLPSFSGPAPIQRALLSHQPYTGVSIQTLDKKHFDRGNILLQEKYPIARDETLFSLIDRLGTKGGQLLKHVLDNKLYDSSVQPYITPTEPFSHAAKIQPQEKLINWHSYTTEHLIRRENTLGPLYTKIAAVSRTGEHGSKRVYLPNLRPAMRLPDLTQPGQFALHDDKLVVATADGAVECAGAKVAGFPEEKPAKFLSSMKKRAGTVSSQFL